MKTLQGLTESNPKTNLEAPHESVKKTKIPQSIWMIALASMLLTFSSSIVTTIGPAEPEHITDPSKLKQVEVSVEWQQEGKLRTLSFVTYLRRQAT